MAVRVASLTNRKVYVLLPVTLAIVLIGYVFLTQSIRSDIPDHGDWWTDMAHVVVARNLSLYGFSAVRFGAVSDNGAEVGLPLDFYSHWPSFPYLMLSSLNRLGLSTTEARLFPLVVSSSALIAIYLLAFRMFGDWRVGFFASLALAASAPFRLLSDAFGYLSYDFAAAIWTFLFIASASLTRGRRRLAWLAAAGVGAFATISLSGFEEVPAIAAYSVLFPLLFARPTSNRREWLRVTLTSGLFVGTGFVLGMGFRLAHNIWLLDGLQPAIADLAQAFVKRSSRPFEYLRVEGYLPVIEDSYFLYYVTMLVNRTLDYFPFHLIVMAAALVFGVLPAIARRAGTAREVAPTSSPLPREGHFGADHPLSAACRGRLDKLPFKWLGIIFFSEILWFVFFRQHSNEHVHTIYHLSLTMSLGAAMAVMIIWQLLGRSALGRLALAAGGAGLLAISLSNTGIQTRDGNLQIQIDWTRQRQEIEMLSSYIPADAVALLDVGNMSPAPDFFLGRTFVRRSWLHYLDESRGRPWFLVTEPWGQAYEGALLNGRWLAQGPNLALFDMNPSLSPSHYGVGEAGEQ